MASKRARTSKPLTDLQGWDLVVLMKDAQFSGSTWCAPELGMVVSVDALDPHQVTITWRDVDSVDKAAKTLRRKGMVVLVDAVDHQVSITCRDVDSVGKAAKTGDRGFCVKRIGRASSDGVAEQESVATALERCRRELHDEANEAALLSEQDGSEELEGKHARIDERLRLEAALELFALMKNEAALPINNVSGRASRCRVLAAGTLGILPATRGAGGRSGGGGRMRDNRAKHLVKALWTLSKMADGSVAVRLSLQPAAATAAKKQRTHHDDPEELPCSQTHALSMAPSTAAATSPTTATSSAHASSSSIVKAKLADKARSKQPRPRVGGLSGDDDAEGKTRLIKAVCTCVPGGSVVVRLVVERDRATVSKYLDELVMRAAKMHVHEMEREEREKVKAARRAEKARGEAEREERKRRAEQEEAAQKAALEAELERKEKEKAELEKAAKMRHMLKVRALEKSRVVDASLWTTVKKNGSVRVLLKLCVANNIQHVTRLADGIAKMMNEYDYRKKHEAFKKGHRWMTLMESIELGLQRNVGEAFAVRSSCGCGGWAKVPWIAVSDPLESTQAGLYMQYLFRADMSAVYLCLGQGTSKLKAVLGSSAALRHLEHVANFVRSKFSELTTAGELEGWDTNGEIDLRADGGLAGDYEKACIISRMYEYGANLDEVTLLKELDEMLTLYLAVLSDPKYQLDIKAPIDEQLQERGFKKGANGRKSDAGGSADQKRAAARKATTTMTPGDDESNDDEDGVDGTPGASDAKRRRVSTGSAGAGGGSAGKTAKGAKGKGAVPAAPKGKGAAALANKEALERLAYDWPIGLRVEVLQDSAEHFGAWFEARVLDHKAPDKIRVEYEELLADGDDVDEMDDTAQMPGLQQLEFVRKVRPLPLPPVDAGWAAKLRVNDTVQLSFIGGWWDVLVTEALPELAPPQWVVKSVHFEATHTVDASQLRPQPKWFWDVPTKSWVVRGREAEIIERMEQARARVAKDESAPEPEVEQATGTGEAAHAEALITKKRSPRKAKKSAPDEPDDNPQPTEKPVKDYRAKAAGGRREESAKLVAAPHSSAPPDGWQWPLEGDKVEVEVASSEDAPAVWVPAEVIAVLVDGTFQARIVLPDGSDQWEDWFSWKEEGSDWRRQVRKKPCEEGAVMTSDYL